MPQIFQVLRCYKCAAFQVHQAKKSNKFECKLCGEKQSIKRHYGIGIAKDCRLHVQKLNSMRGEIDELKCDLMAVNIKSEVSEDEELDSKEIKKKVNCKQVNSKWSDYVEEQEPKEDTANEPMCHGDAKVVLEIHKKHRKQFSNCSKSNNVTKPVECSLSTGRSGLYNTCSITNRFQPPANKSQEINLTYHLNVDSTEATNIDVSNERLDKENSKSNVPCKKFVPPIIHKNSKWAEFVDEESEVPLTSPVMSQNDHIFSLCDDNELDSVLDI